MSSRQWYLDQAVRAAKDGNLPLAGMMHRLADAATPLDPAQIAEVREHFRKKYTVEHSGWHDVLIILGVLAAMALPSAILALLAWLS
jgi:hypothetical protein